MYENINIQLFNLNLNSIIYFDIIDSCNKLLLAEEIILEII